MSRTTTLACATLLALPLAASADAVIYRCVGKHGLVYQDTPCAGARDTQNRVLVTGTVAQPPQTETPPPRGDTSLSRWVERTSKANRVREAENHVKAIERRNRADEAEFAAMMADVEDKQRQADELVADTPPIYQLDADRAALRQNYVERAQQNQLELNLARKALEAEQEQ